MLKKTCCFTGHRNLPKNHISQIIKLLEYEIECLINQGIIYFGTGGAIGFDTISALSVLKLRKKYSHIRLILVLPFPEQDKLWNTHDKNIYSYIKNNSNKIVYISPTYEKSSYKKRNFHLVKNSCYCISYLTDYQSGTSSTINIAENLGLKIINIAKKNPLLLQ